MEASALHAPATIGRISISGPLLRLRSDEQLVALFRAGNEEAFRVIHDRYRQRLFAYVRQMLAGSRPDAEDAMQDVFIRAYRALRSNDRPITLRAWLYRVAHNRCIDELRRPAPPASDLFEVSRTPTRDPIVETERRDELRRLVADVGRLPEQQRSALLMRELQGLSYLEMAEALGTSVSAVKSLLVRARMGLVEASESRDTACADICSDLVLALDRGVRMSGRVRRHVRDCAGCREFRHELRGVRRGLSAMVPAGTGPLGLMAKLGLGGSGAAAGGGAATGGGVAVIGGGALAATTTKLALVCCAAVVTAGGALALPRAIHARATPHHKLQPRSARAPTRPAPHAVPTVIARPDIEAPARPTPLRRLAHRGRVPIIDPDASLFGPAAKDGTSSTGGAGRPSDAPAGGQPIASQDEIGGGSAGGAVGAPAGAVSGSGSRPASPSANAPGPAPAGRDTDSPAAGRPLSPQDAGSTDGRGSNSPPSATPSLSAGAAGGSAQ